MEKQHSIDLSFFAKVWFVGWRVLLRILLGKEDRNRVLSSHPEINRIIRGWFLFLHCDGVLIVPGDSEIIIREVYKLDVYGSDRIENNDVVVDLGAHAGIFTLKSARRSGLVVAVEPYPPNFRLLLTNIRINRLENVIPVNVALGNHNGEVEFYVATQSGSHTISKSRKDHSHGMAFPIFDIKPLKVKLRTLDSMIRELGIKRVNFIKIDAEGAELDILKGANSTLLNNAKMKVAIASYHFPEEKEKIRDFLRERDFQNFIFREGILMGLRP